MPTPKKGETREQMNERRRRESLGKTLDKAISTLDTPAQYVPNFTRGKWSPGTGKVYEIAWRHWETYCRKHDCCSLPARAEHVAAFLHKHARAHATSTVSQALAAIRAIHKDAKGQLPKTDPHREMYLLDDPIIEDAWAEIRRQKGTANTPKAPILKDDLQRIIRRIPEKFVLDRALLLVGFTSALRRSELVALNKEDLSFSDEGLVITIRRSKTDKNGQGQTVSVQRGSPEFCPVAALERLIESEGITTGPIFRNRFGERIVPSTVAFIVKDWAVEVGFERRAIGAHSLRRGCITEMNRAGVNMRDGMAHSRHKTVSIYMNYAEPEEGLKNPGVRSLRM